MSNTIVLSGGGTAGHIYPALALAERLIVDGYDVKFAGTPNGLESKLVADAGIEFKAFEASGFDRARPLTLITGIFRIIKSTRQAKKWFKQIRPACVVGFGGYVSIPVTRAAESLHIPVVIHEQNSVMGLANSYISRRASAVALTYPLESSSTCANTHLVGNPVRKSVVSANREEGLKYLDVPNDAEVLVVFGGSGGAKHLNQAISRLKDKLLANSDLYIIHITGTKDYDDTLSALDLSDSQAIRYKVKSYEDNMGLVLAAADCVVSRAGATSLAEIAARAIPAVLVPYPYARSNHQALNVKSYAEAKAAVVVDDSLLDADVFADAVISLLDKDNRATMKQAALQLEAGDAATKLADVVKSCINN